jgi:hypothetical protein
MYDIIASWRHGVKKKRTIYGRFWADKLQSPKWLILRRRRCENLTPFLERHKGTATRNSGIPQGVCIAQSLCNRNVARLAANLTKLPTTSTASRASVAYTVRRKMSLLGKAFSAMG